MGCKPDFICTWRRVNWWFGPQSEMEKIKLVLGEETEVPMDMNASHRLAGPGN